MHVSAVYTIYYIYTREPPPGGGRGRRRLTENVRVVSDGPDHDDAGAAGHDGRRLVVRRGAELYAPLQVVLDVEAVDLHHPRVVTNVV